MKKKPHAKWAAHHVADFEWLEHPFYVIWDGFERETKNLVELFKNNIIIANKKREKRCWAHECARNYVTHVLFL